MPHQNMEDILQLRYGLSRIQARQVASETRLAIGLKADVAWSKKLEEQCIALCAQRGLILKDRKQLVPGFLQACSDSFTMLSITEQESFSQIEEDDDEEDESDDSTIHSEGGNAPWWRMNDSDDVLGAGAEEDEDLLELSDDDASAVDSDENDTEQHQTSNERSQLRSCLSEGSTHTRTSSHERATVDHSQESPSEPPVSPLQSFLSTVSGSKRVRFVTDNAKSIRSIDSDTMSLTNTTISSSDTLTTHSSGWRLGQHPRRPFRRSNFPPQVSQIPTSPLRAGFHDSAQDERARTSPRVPRRRMSIESPAAFEPPLHVVVEAPSHHVTEQSEE